MNDDMDSYLIAMDTSIAPGPSSVSNVTTASLASAECSKQAAVTHRMRLHSADEDETDDTDGPQNKKVLSRLSHQQLCFITFICISLVGGMTIEEKIYVTQKRSGCCEI